MQIFGLRRKFLHACCTFALSTILKCHHFNVTFGVYGNILININDFNTWNLFGEVDFEVKNCL